MSGNISRSGFFLFRREEVAVKVEVVNEELVDYRSWLRLVDCGHESLGCRYIPIVAVKARVADVGKCLTFAVPSASFVWRWCYDSVWCCRA